MCRNWINKPGIHGNNHISVRLYLLREFEPEFSAEMSTWKVPVKPRCTRPRNLLVFTISVCTPFRPWWLTQQPHIWKYLSGQMIFYSRTARRIFYVRSSVFPYEHYFIEHYMLLNFQFVLHTKQSKPMKRPIFSQYSKEISPFSPDIPFLKELLSKLLQYCFADCWGAIRRGGI